jgi:hypothetical protein
MNITAKIFKILSKKEVRIHLLNGGTLLLIVSLIFIIDYQTRAQFGNFINYQNSEFRLIPNLYATIPLLCVFFILFIITKAISAFILSIFIYFCLSFADFNKRAQTGQPLNYYDIANTDMLSVALAYVSSSIIICALLFFSIFIYFSRFRFCIKNLYISIIFITISLHIIYPRGVKNYPNFFADISLKFATSHGLDYQKWDMIKNHRSNGLLIHLAQTADKVNIGQATELDLEKLNELHKENNFQIEFGGKQQIFYILCESCWHNSKYFNEAFQPLKDAGFKAIRGISPVYGGNTVNASFEILTGLPSKSVLNGVIYQSYYKDFSNHSFTLPQSFRNNQFRTFAAHNFKKSFWQRNTVLKKFGFDTFYGLEDMKGNINSRWSRDYILYKKSKEFLNANKNEKVFSFLTTMYLHGPYRSQDPVNDYETRLKTTINDLKSFAKFLKNKYNNPLIVIIGDHKPSLTKFFKEANIIEEKFLINSNGVYTLSPSAPQEIIGDVPIYIYSRDTESHLAIKEMDGKSFFCLAQKLDELFIQSNTPGYLYSKDICDKDLGYQETLDQYQSWIYRAALFQKNHSEILP